MKLFDFLKRNPKKTEENPMSIIAYHDMEQALKRTSERFKCLMTVLERQGKPRIYEFHTTSKGVPVLLCIDAMGTEIELYNLNTNPNAECRLKLKAETIEDVVRIVQITGGMRMGHGRLAVSRLIQQCIQIEVKRLECTFMATSKERAEIFSYFFTKIGFHVFNSERNVWVAHLQVEPSKNYPNQ